MTEEINYSYQGGLYGELIQNRDFKDPGPTTRHWSLRTDPGAAGTMTLDAAKPVNTTALTTSLRLEVAAADANHAIRLVNDGYWGIPVRPETTYRASFYARAKDFPGPLTASIESADGTTVYARAEVSDIGAEWRQYTVALTTGKVAPTKNARFLLTATHPGTVWLNLVSLFPPTYNNRPNGNRVDLMEKLVAMKPSFLRFPGGNYVEGDTFDERFDWKKTIGPVAERPGHRSPWNYHSTDGLGLLEFLEWCEDMRAEPLLAVFAGFTLRGGHVAGEALQPYVDEALEEVEYITGDVSTPWGARRAVDGHPAPFPLKYVEIGNEDFFDHSGSYDRRFAQFHDAFKARYPQLQLITTAPVSSRVPDLVDDHFYNTWDKMAADVHHYDGFSRSGPKVLVGEWASQDAPAPWVRANNKGPTPTLMSALGDAAWMIGMERNSDVVALQCYAPLFVNMNPGGRQWAINLIGYDAL
ncbi:MAG: carbohydrate binding domain-containing protein, partial [Rhodospirillales bacterium]|nr:carbohydrate binding domain-containing protein [Acetobacter sp.]